MAGDWGAQAEYLSVLFDDEEYYSLKFSRRQPHGFPRGILLGRIVIKNHAT
jgi:hypothetical protein